MNIHQGGKLQHLVKNDKRTNEELATLWNVSIATMYNYFAMQEIPSKKLRRISEIMGWDYNSVFITNENKSETEALKRENDLLRKQVAQLEKMVGMLEKKKRVNA